MKPDRYIEKWLNGTLNDEERREFEKTETYKELKELSDSIQKFKAPTFDTESELLRFSDRIKGKGKVVRMNWQKILLRVAAMLTIVVGSYIYYMYYLPATIETTAAQKKRIFLPDSSEVILNAVSKIKFNENRWNRDRRLVLDGEAYFKVRKGSIFSVETSTGTVRVLGTEFNVKQRKEFFEVVCFEGLVQVTTSLIDNKLPALHSIRILNGEVIQGQFKDTASPSWIGNESEFNSVPFSQVIQEFERQYNTSIVSESVDMDALFTGRFTHEDMILALESITIPHHITYQITEDQQILLSGESE